VGIVGAGQDGTRVRFDSAGVNEAEAHERPEAEATEKLVARPPSEFRRETA
jgi:hypothetical protein